jgi:hypothetical protein
MKPSARRPFGRHLIPLPSNPTIMLILLMVKIAADVIRQYRQARPAAAQPATPEPEAWMPGPEAILPAQNATAG